MAIQKGFADEFGSVVDLSEGERYAVTRLRQLRSLSDETPEKVQSLIVINIASCLEWYARSKLKQLVDFYSDYIDKDAKLIRDVRLNVPLLIETRITYSVGDLVALSNNFSSLEDIEAVFIQLLIKKNPGLKQIFRTLLFKVRPNKQVIDRQLTKMFRLRHEIVHGSPRPLIYEEQAQLLASKREVSVFITYSLQFIRIIETFLHRTVPGYGDRSNMEMLFSEADRASKIEDRMATLEKSLLERIDGDRQKRLFRQTQKAWRTWQLREATFQSYSIWGGGTGEHLARVGEFNSLALQRIRQLELYLREFDQGIRMGGAELG